jgi:hypothetical protein
MGQAAMQGLQGISGAVQNYYQNQMMAPLYANLARAGGSSYGGDIGRSYAAQQAGFASAPGMFGPYPS